MPNPAGYILTGGRSRRMGTDKGRLELDGRTLVERTARELGRVCGSVTLVGRGYEGMAFAVLPDAVDAFGPAAGILSVLRDGLGWKLVVACDMPGLDTGLFAQLAAVGDGTNADCVIPVGPDGRQHPLCAAYHHRALPAWESAVARDTRKVLDIVARLNALRIPIADAAVLRNVNTPADWQEYLDAH